ncbi:MAG: outer membrane beta-barrel protein [Pricia sp.]
MKKIISYLAIAAITLLSVQSISAQEFSKGTNVINAGLGFGGAYDLGRFNSSLALGLNVSYERGIWEVGGPGVISLGGYIGTTAYNLDFGVDDDTVRYTSFGVRGAYHFNFIGVDNLDVYAGPMITVDVVSVDNDAFDTLDGGLSGSVFAGARWYFTDNFGAFAELGYGVSFLSLGAAFRF